jgi:SAM-dependent methyltransferase
MNCDGIARYYQGLEYLSFGGFLEQSRFTFLGETKESQRAILCGDGDGRFLARLLLKNSRVEVDYVDLSPRMIEVAERRVAKMGPDFRERVRFHARDVREFVPRPDGYDLIVTHFFLDCFSEAELAPLVARLGSWGTPGARWIISDFREGGGPIDKVWTSAVIRSLYAAFRFTTGLRVTRLPNYMSVLARERYVLSREKNFLRRLLHASIWVRCP